MDQVAVMKRVVEQTGAVVDGIREDQLGNATGCSEWTVRDIVNHITGGATMFSECIEGPVSDERLGQLVGGDNLGDNFKGSFHAAADKAVSTFDQPGTLEKMVKLPFGEMPGGIALTSPPTPSTWPRPPVRRSRTPNSWRRRWPSASR
jgi:uncharacterized protein (TIGR03086 family)